MTHPAQVQSWLNDLKQGNTFCVSCGQTQAKQLPRCVHCFQTDKPANYCKFCGEKIDSDRLQYAKRMKGECHTCMPCKKGYRQSCKNCGVLHPKHWKCEEIPVENV